MRLLHNLLPPWGDPAAHCYYEPWPTCNIGTLGSVDTGDTVDVVLLSMPSNMNPQMGRPLPIQFCYHLQLQANLLQFLTSSPHSLTEVIHLF